VGSREGTPEVSELGRSRPVSLHTEAREPSQAGVTWLCCVTCVFTSAHILLRNTPRSVELQAFWKFVC